LPPRDRIRAYKELRKAAEEATDNEFQQMILLMSATGQELESETQVTSILDKIDAATLGITGIKAISALKRMSSTARNLSHVPDVATTVVDVAARSEDAAASVSMSRLDA
ncbi:hypothetical protein, partial [Vibrio cholerae]